MPVKAGPHGSGVAFTGRPSVTEGGVRRAWPSEAACWRAPGRRSELTVIGPFKGKGPTPRRRRPRRRFSCAPGDGGRRDAVCHVDPVDARASRLPPAGQAAEVCNSLFAFLPPGPRGAARSRPVFRRRSGQSSRRRQLPLPVGARSRRRGASGMYRLTDLELASRLSFFLWSSIPDDELLTAASTGKLKDPAVLEQQVRRMLADPRASALPDSFFGQWLTTKNLRTSGRIRRCSRTSTRTSARRSSKRRSSFWNRSCGRIGPPPSF